jgi:hypothetical protein
MFRAAPHVSGSGVMAQFEQARRLAFATDSALQLGRERELSPSEALRSIPSLSSDAIHLDVKVVMAPSNSRSIYADPDRWERGGTSFTSIAGIQDFIAAIEQTGLPELQLAWALENLYNARWFINWIELQNLSSHATVHHHTLFFC